MIEGSLSVIESVTFYKCYNMTSIYYYSSTVPTCSVSTGYICNNGIFFMNSPTCDRYYPTVYVPESYDSSTFCEADTVKNGVVLANLKRSYKKLYS